MKSADLSWLVALLIPVGAFAAPISREQLVAANYRTGMLAFQQRCSACHSLAEGANDLAGPNLYGVFQRKAGGRPAFGYSSALDGASFTWDPDRLAAFLRDPAGVVPGTTMMLPESVPEADLIPLISFVMLETGAADWPKPTPPRPARPAGSPGVSASDADVATRFPTFWNHLMTNTTRYRLNSGDEEFRFDAYFNQDGSVSSSVPGMRGFWRVDERDFFCYALYDLPIAPKQFVECFPVVAMSIPRFREDLWTTTLPSGESLTGGIVAGRPAAAPPASAP